MINRTSKHIRQYEQTRGNYPALSRAAEIMPPPPADILGRDLNELRRGLRNPEKANVALLAEPGTGKTAYVQGFAYDPESLKYYLVLEVNPERLIEKTGDRDNALLTGFNELLDQAARYSKENDVIVVLFVDEFHKMMQISPSLMESLKPRLEKSALNGFRLIAATTFQEYNETIAQNRALDQRFLQIKLTELPKEAVLTVLENRAKQHGVYEHLDNGVLEDIYIESKRILMSNAQPRASIDILNSMIGDTVKSEHMENGKLVKEFYTPAELGFDTEKVLSRPLLKRIIKRAHGIDIDNTVDVKNVINALQTRLFNQDNAIQIVTRLLEVAAHGFSELDRPKFSFLSTGSTGTGKALPDTWDIPAPVPGGYVKNGELKPGDWVYNRQGKKIRVTDVFHKGLRTVYLVTLSDGRQIECARDHLWTYRRQNGYDMWKTATTEELMEMGVTSVRSNGRISYNFAIPQNEAVERDAISCIANPHTVGSLIGASKWEELRNMAEIGMDSDNCSIPDIYKFASIKQRWNLIQGLFDACGYVASENVKPMFGLYFNSRSKRLTEDVQEVLWSLGVSSTFLTGKRHGQVMYKLVVHVHNKDKLKFFRNSKYFYRAVAASRITMDYERSDDIVTIKSIKKLDRKEPMTCIMVDDPEHLYLAGKEHIVTHNTELAKIVSQSMMIPLKRFDMSRYGDPLMAKEFADTLFQAAWSTPNAYILIDEVEKSSKRAMNILLQVLDDARLTDSANPDRVASFTGCIINLTTNVGSEIYQNMQKFQSASAEADQELVYKALCNAQDSDGKPLFETAVLGRLDEIVPFHPLPISAMEKIAMRTLMDAVEMAQTSKRKIIVSDDVIPYIVKDRTSNDTERGGARDAKRNVRNLVVQQLAHYLTYATEEVPVIIYLKGRPRFKYSDVADPLNAQVDIMECWPIGSASTILKKFSEKLHKPLIDRGLYFPKSRSLDDYARELASLVSAGHFQFKTQIDGEKVSIKGV